MEIEAPTEDDLADAPLIEGWELRRAVLSRDRHQLHGVFFGHPEIAAGEHGHSSDVLHLDDAEPHRWAVCTSREYIDWAPENSGLPSS